MASKRPMCTLGGGALCRQVVDVDHIFDLLLRTDLSFTGASTFDAILQCSSTSNKMRRAFWADVRDGTRERSCGSGGWMRENTCDLCDRARAPTWKRQVTTDVGWPPRTWQACLGGGRCVLAAMRGMWASSASYNAYPVFRRPTRTAVPRASGMFSPGVVAGYHWSTDQLTWCALVHFASSEYETAEEAERACATIDVFTTLTQHLSLAVRAAGAGDLFLTA
jgi:hypothetical protein